MNSAKELLAEFEALSTAEWLQKIDKYLKGKPFDSIIHHPEDGLNINPFYRREETSQAFATAPFVENNWLIGETIICSGDIAAANKQIIAALHAGVDALNLRIDAASPQQLEALLKGVFLNMVDINLLGIQIDAEPLPWLDALAKLPNSEQSCGSFIFTKTSVENIDEVYRKMATFLPKWTLCNISLSLSEVNSVATTTLANALQEANLLFEALLAHGLSADEAQQQFRFSVTISDDYFLSIATLRALKRLWLGFIEAYDVKAAILPKIHVITNKSTASDDAYWNMISNTTQALSAAIAQVYSIEVQASDGQEKATAFSRRIARNVQHLLKMESLIGHVIDPAAGAYYIENYTAALTEKAWKTFLNKNVAI